MVAEQSAARQAVIVTGASLFIALCARLSIFLPFTPVPLTLGNMAVLMVGLVLGSRLGFVSLMLYLAEGAAGLPFFSAGPGGVAQLFGPTGGYLLAYPASAFVTGWLWERSPRSFARAVAAAVAGEMMLFSAGVAWLMLLTHSLPQAIGWGLVPFVFAEVIKVMTSAGAAYRLRRRV